jgi:WD40 repeat protein
MMAEEPLDGFCEGLAFSKDGRTVVTSTCNKGQITFWHTPDLAPVKPGYPSEQATFGPSTSFAVSPDLSLAACGLAGGRIRVIDMQDGHELWTEKAVKDFVTTLAFSQDGKILASAGGFTASDSDIHLWDAVTGRKIGLLEGHKRWVGSLVFWPDGKKLASGSGDQTIRIWDIAEQRCRDVLRGHRNEVWRLALMPDGRTLVSGCKDGTVCVWDASVTHPRPKSITWTNKIAAWCFTLDGRSVVALKP